MIFKLLAEGVCQPREAAHLHPPSEIEPHVAALSRIALRDVPLFLADEFPRFIEVTSYLA
jgi:hypothetical protein